VEQAQEQYYNFWAETNSKGSKPSIDDLDLNFAFFYFFTSILQKKYIVRKKFAKLYIWRRGGRRQGPTAVPHSGRRRVVL
jgi:hypothetical protein